MSIEGIQNAFQTNISQQASAAATTDAARGTFMGHEVAVAASPESLLADASEELGFAVDTTDKFSISERKERESTEINRRLMEIYRVLMSRAGQSEKMQQAVDALKRGADRQSMRATFQGLFEDPTDAWAAMQLAIETLEDDPSFTDKQMRELRGLSEEFAKELGEAIRLGLRGAVSGEGFPELGGMDGTRDLYRRTVGEFSSVNEVFSEIKAKYGAGFDKAMDFLFSAISADIDCETPSMGRAHLESVHQKLALVRLTQSAYALCETLTDRWESVHGEGRPLSAMELLGEVMDLRGKSYVSASQINDICAKAKPSDIEHEVLFLQELLATVRKFPVELFDDESGRMRILDAVQSSVDDAVAREDEYLASLE